MTKFESNCSQLPLKDLEEHNAKMKEVAAYPASAEEIHTNGTTRREKNNASFFFVLHAVLFSLFTSFGKKLSLLLSTLRLTVAGLAGLTWENEF